MVVSEYEKARHKLLGILAFFKNDLERYKAHPKHNPETAAKRAAAIESAADAVDLMDGSIKDEFARLSGLSSGEFTRGFAAGVKSTEVKDPATIPDRFRTPVEREMVRGESLTIARQKWPELFTNTTYENKEF